MPDNLRPYTVSAVVNTDTGELVGTPIVRIGHEDYNRFSTVKPLAANEQFRWVHVRAPDEATAAATETLTADLRPGGDRNRPLARALTGEPGLKRYTVDDEEPRLRMEVAREVPDELRRSVDLDVAAVAQREWTRMTGLPLDARAALVADTVWNREYPTAYCIAYTTAAGRIAAQAIAAASGNPDAWPALQRLAAAAGHAISQQAAELPAVPPADHRTVTAAQAVSEQPGERPPPWQRVADRATTDSRIAATLAGTLTVTTDVLAGWRLRSGHALCGGITVDGQPVRAWIGNLLATVNRDIARGVSASAGTNIAGMVGASALGRTVPQLAREDQAPGAPPPTPGVAGGRTRPAASPASSSAQRTR